MIVIIVFVHCIFISLAHFYIVEVVVSFFFIVFCLIFIFFFFFFQAEDGIRDFHVTGVQTCALPIFHNPPPNYRFQSHPHAPVPPPPAQSRASPAPRSPAHPSTTSRPAHPADRSEERRVGKECRSRWSPEH